jgi:hypothetical protein
MDVWLQRLQTFQRTVIVLLLAPSTFLFFPGTLHGQRVPTSLTVNPATGTFGGNTELVAALTVDAENPDFRCVLAGQEIDFTLNGVDVGSATTNIFGIATHIAVLGDIDAGTYPEGPNSGVGARFNGDPGNCRSSEGVAELVVNRAAQVIVWSDPADISLGTPLGAFQLNATLTPGDGALTYDPPAGTLLPLGTHALQVSAAETTNFEAASAQVSITVVLGVSITTLNLPNGVLGSPYTEDLEATGGIQPYQWSLTEGELPPGLNLNSSTDSIQGTPVSAGTFPFTVQVSDSGTIPDTDVRTFEITVPSIPKILNLISAVGTFGGTIELVAFLDVVSFPDCVAEGQQISFTLNGIDVGSAPTDSSGVATHAASLGGINAGMYPGGPESGVGASFNGGAPGCETGEASSDLVVNKAGQIISWSNPADISLGTPLGPLQLNATLTTGDGGLTYDPPIGTLLPVGTHPLQVNAAETTNFEAATTAVSITVVDGVVITTLELPDGVLGTLYTQVLQANGGTQPYLWSLIQGELPPGLLLNSSTGSIQGTPISAGTFPFTVRVNDSSTPSDAADRMFAFTVVDSPFDLPLVSVTGLPSTVNPAAQLDVGLSLNQPRATPISGTLTLAFEPDAVVPSDDPMLQFSNGSRTVNFEFPANSTVATLMPPVSLLTGTVSGAVHLTISAEGGPASIQVGSATIPRLPPRISSVMVSKRTDGGLEIGITGYSTERRVTTATFTFSIRTATGLQQFPLTRSVEQEFNGWYQSPVSEPFGSTFLFLQSFTVQGNSAAVESVTVRLVNREGTTSSGPVFISSP